MLPALLLLSALTPALALTPATLIARQGDSTSAPVCGILPGVAKLCCTPEFQGELLANPNATHNLFCRVPADQNDAYRDCIAEHTEPDGVGSEGCFGSPELLVPTTLPESVAAVGTTQGASGTASATSAPATDASGTAGETSMTSSVASPSATSGATRAASGVLATLALALSLVLAM